MSVRMCNNSELIDHDADSTQQNTMGYLTDVRDPVKK